MPAPGDRRIDRQPPDMQPGNVERDVRQKRRIGIARPKREIAGEPRLRDVELAHVDPPAEQIGERPVVERRHRCGRERALRIGEGDVAQRQPAVDRALDPFDVDLQPRRRLGRVDPVDDEAVARFGVQPEQEGEGGRDQHREHDRRPFGDPPPQRPPADDHDGLGGGGAGGFGRHQKACPIET